MKETSDFDNDDYVGMVMDVPGLGQERYQNFDELYTYCYRVAGTVGLMTLPILGAAEGTYVQYVYNVGGLFAVMEWNAI